MLLNSNFVSLRMAMLTLVRVHHPPVMPLPAVENVAGSIVLSPSSLLLLAPFSSHSTTWPMAAIPSHHDVTSIVTIGNIDTAIPLLLPMLQEL